MLQRCHREEPFPVLRNRNVVQLQPIERILVDDPSLHVEVDSLVRFYTEELVTGCEPGDAVDCGTTVDACFAYAFGRPDCDAACEFGEEERAVGGPHDLADETVWVGEDSMRGEVLLHEVA